jgi:SPP1 family predicted phage head-tail adaptor
MSVINPGELRDVLTIHANNSEGSYDENGFPVEAYQQIYKLRCKKKTISTKEFIAGDRETSELQYKFIVRKRNIDNTMLVKYKDKNFDIKHVHEIDDFFLELTVNETLEGV